MIFVVFAAVAIGMCTALWGWGIFCQRLAKYPVRNWAVTIIFGLGCIIFWGGVLNLLRLAYGWTFDGLLLIGIALAVKYRKFRPQLPRDAGEWFHLAILCMPVVLIMFFTVKTQLPPQVFNYHDDFEKYFTHPVRMLQTGTLFGSPLSALGSETLGGQAVLHAIAINHFPVQYINGVDAVFGLLLCLLLSVSIFPLRAEFLPMCLIGLLMVFFINPQYVNVSSLYIAGAFMMTSILLFSDVNGYENDEKTKKLPSPVLAGLIYAALIASKSSFVMFALFHLLSFVIALKIFGVDFRRLARWGLMAAGTTLLFLLPWILLYLPYYFHSSPAQAPHRTDIVAAAEEFPNLLSTSPLVYGASFAHYTFICMAPLVSVIGAALWKRPERSVALAGLMAGGFAVAFVYLLLLYLGPAISSYETSVRYAVPVLIAGAPVILSLIYLMAFRGGASWFKLSFVAIPLLFGILVIISFSSPLVARIRHGYNSGSILAFSKFAATREYIEYSEEVIYGSMHSRVIAAQKYVPAGQAVVVWMGTSFHLDYKRNTVYDADRSGIATPWAYVPDADYFLFEYKGSAVSTLEQYLNPSAGRRERYISEKCILFLQFFQELRKNSDELYDDGRIVVLKKRRMSS
jgi:hypothetical protein